MVYDKEEEVMMVESLEGSQMWTEKSMGYLGDDVGNVYLTTRDSDGEETSEAFSPAEAVGLAIELLRAADTHASYLAPLERRLRWMQTEKLTAEFSGMEMEELDQLSVQMFNVELVDRSMTLDDVRSVIRAYKRSQA